MPKRRYERREPTHEWQQIQPLLKDTAQPNDEVIRPVIVWGSGPKNEVRKLGTTTSHLFDQTGMALCCPRNPPPPIPTLDKRSLPFDIRLICIGKKHFDT